MVQLNENKFELDLHTKNFYTFQDKNGDNAKISVGSMQKADDTDFVRQCIRKLNSATQFAYFNNIGDDAFRLKEAAASGSPKTIERARVEFARHSSHYIMSRRFPMVIKDNEKDFVVRGEFRLSDHTVDPSTWKSNGHRDFGISVVINDCRVQPKKFNGSGVSRIEIWEYSVKDEDADKVLELYDYVFHGKKITKEKCDEIMQQSPQPIRDGGPNMDMELNKVKEHKPYIPPTFTIDDAAEAKKFWTNPENNEQWPMVDKGEQTFVFDEKTFTWYLLKKNGRLSKKNKYTLENRRRRIAMRLTESRLRKIIREAIMDLGNFRFNTVTGEFEGDGDSHGHTPAGRRAIEDNEKQWRQWDMEDDWSESEDKDRTDRIQTTPLDYLSDKEKHMQDQNDPYDVNDIYFKKSDYKFKTDDWNEFPEWYQLKRTFCDWDKAEAERSRNDEAIRRIVTESVRKALRSILR